MGVESNCELLAKLFEADQEDRQLFAEGRLDPKLVKRRDARRRSVVRPLIEARKLNTAADFYHAAMILHHGTKIGDFDGAHRLALSAVELAEGDTQLQGSAKWLVAAAWDRGRMRRGRPQWYGTQFVQEQPESHWELYAIDETALSDNERREMNVPTLAETRAQLAKMNKGL